MYSYWYDCIRICLCDACRCNGKSENERKNGDEERISKYSFVSPLCMRGGDGYNSYSSNSLLQVFFFIYISFIFIRLIHAEI